MRAVRFLTATTFLATLAILAPTGVVAATTMPTHVYSPYFETWTTDSLTTTAQQSGARYFTMAFLETTSKTSCTLVWNGDKARGLTANPVPYATDIAGLRALGGDVIPSFGGWSADQGGPRSATRAPTSTPSPRPMSRSSRPTTSAGSTWTSRAGR